MVLVAVGDVDIAAVQEEVEKQCSALPRGGTAAKALAHSFTLVVPDMKAVSDNRPCHLQLFPDSKFKASQIHPICSFVKFFLMYLSAGLVIFELVCT